ncbi:unnamed protein product, partial [Brenthis ino]
MWGTLLLLYFVAGSYQISISEFSVPQSIEFGENATLKCLYELSPEENDKALFVKWWWTPINGTSDIRHQLYQRIAGHSPEVIRKDIIINENDGISLENVTAEDSGIYECEVSNIDEVRKHGELIVYKLGEGPELNITLNVTADGPDEDSEEDVSVLVTCTASDVAPEPNLIITVNGNEVETEKMIEPSSENTYGILETAILTKQNADGADIVCQLVIEPVNVTHPHVGAQTFYFNPTGDASFVPSSCALLVIATFLVRLAVN